jgi:hypothetical protein
MPPKRIIFFLLFVPPMVAELLSGNMPPLMFFNPLLMAIMVLLYGCGVLLIREARVRWDLQWSVMLLAIAYGIVEEGLCTKAFFNTQWAGVGNLSGYGMVLGVQWVWAIGVTFYHATVSTLIPISIADLLWPQWCDKPLLKRRGLILAFAGLGLVVLVGLLFMGTTEGDSTVPFRPHPALWLGAAVVVVALVWAAWRWRHVRVRAIKPWLLSPPAIGVLAFVAQVLFLIGPHILKQKGASGAATLGVELMVVVAVIAVALSQLLHERRTVRHIVAAVIGSLMPYILLTPLHEFNPAFTPGKPGTGMLVVGIAALVLLILWRRAVLRRVSAPTDSSF